MISLHVTALTYMLSGAEDYGRALQRDRGVPQVRRKSSLQPRALLLSQSWATSSVVSPADSMSLAEGRTSIFQEGVLCCLLRDVLSFAGVGARDTRGGGRERKTETGRGKGIHAHTHTHTETHSHTDSVLQREREKREREKERERDGEGIRVLRVWGKL